MFIGSFISIVISLALIWNITVTKDLRREWMVWVIVTLGFILFIGGYLYEKRYEKEQAKPLDTEK